MYYQSSKIEFIMALSKARDVRPEVKAATTHPTDLPDAVWYYLHADERSGFGITEDGELIAVFSVDKGRGQGIMEAAESRGAAYLDHFDGYLSDFYQRRGWVEYKREPNWVDGQPAVVYRTLNA